MLLSNCEVSSNKNSKFIKDQEVSKSLSSLGIKKIIVNKILRVSMSF